MNINDCNYILKEYKIDWIFNRFLYSSKMKLLNVVPCSEKIFEKNFLIKRVDMIRFDVELLKNNLLNLNSDKKNEIITIAEDAVHGRIKGFSNIKLDYGNPIDWSLNPLSGEKAGMNLKWYQIPDFHPTRGDIKVIWEASRFTHFYYFARAYLISGEKKYYRAFSEQLEDWLNKNKYSYGPNYKCGQECSLRLINALMVFTLFKQEGLTSKKDESNINKLITVSYKKIRSNFFYAHKCIKNNHTLSELCGMIVGAWCSEDNKQLNAGYKLLNKEIEYQFFEDGGYRQYSFTYQRLALQLMEFIHKIEPSTKNGLTPANKQRIQNSASLLYQLQNNAGDVPNYGSNDGALIFPVSACSYRDFRPVVDGIMKLYAGKSIYETGEYNEEAIWFLNGNELPLCGTAEQVRIKTSFNTFGCYVLRNKDRMLITYLQNFTSRPAHMDQLHVDIWYRGINIFCDNGTYSYATELCNALSLTQSHNTVKIIGQEQMRKKSPFLVYAWPEGKTFDFTEHRFSGQIKSKNGYIHQRTIETIQYGYKIVDKIKNAERYEVLFHTPCRVLKNKNILELVWENKVVATIENNSSEVEIRPCYRSLFYLQKEEILEISFMHDSKSSKTIILLKGDETND